MILLIFAGPAHLELNIRIDLPSLQFIHGWYQKSHGVVYIWTVLLISWVLIGWYWWMLIPNTLVFILPSPFLRRVSLTYWSKTFHISVIHIPLLLTILYVRIIQEVLQRERDHPLDRSSVPSINQWRAAKRLVLTFKQALRKSAQLPKKALLAFLRQYRKADR